MPKSQGKVVKQCRNCGIDFIYCFYENRTLYCSELCKIASRIVAKRKRDKIYSRDGIASKTEYDKMYYLRNSDKIKERTRLYRQKNKDTRWIKEKEYLKNNPQRYLYKRIQSLLGTYLRKSKVPKYAKTFQMLDFTLPELEFKLKSSIPDGYSWNDFLNGELHIDHIKPHCLFSYTSHKDQDFKKCWSLDNLQLLTAKDNIKKQGDYEQD